MAYTARGCEDDVRHAIASTGKAASVRFVPSAAALREALHDEEPRSCCAAVGLSDEGVSDVNAAAALVADGLADEVILVVRGVSGSLRSRSSAAGISRVIDVEALDLDEPVFDGPCERGRGGSEAQGDAVADPSLEHEETASVGGESQGNRQEQRIADKREAEGRAGRIPTGPALQISRRVRAPYTGKAGPVITFASGRGGVGKTALIAVAAITAASWGMRVALLDFDLCCGNLAGAFGNAKRSDLSELGQDGSFAVGRLGSCGVSCGENISLWGPVERPEMAETVMPLAGDLIRHLAGTFDVVLIDTSSTCTDAVAQAMQSSDRVVMVHDGRPGAIVAVSRISSLAVRLGVARTQIVRVDNRCPSRLWGQAFLPRAEPGLETARAYRVLDGGDEVSELCAEGKVSELVDLGGDYVRSVAAFVGGLLRELGSLPECDEAKAAVEGAGLRKRASFFGLRREAV